MGAAAVIVHGGHAEDGVERGYCVGRRSSRSSRPPFPILIENTAGGTTRWRARIESRRALAAPRRLRQLDSVSTRVTRTAAGENLDDVMERVLDADGKTIDLVHANETHDPPGTGGSTVTPTSRRGTSPTSSCLRWFRPQAPQRSSVKPPRPQIKDNIHDFGRTFRSSRSAESPLRGAS